MPGHVDCDDKEPRMFSDGQQVKSMLRHFTALIATVAVAASGVVQAAGAQSASAVSLQASGMAISSSNIGVSTDGEDTNSGIRFGWEGQFRYNPPGRFSIGVGFEQSTVYVAPASQDFSVRLQSFFVEPRFVAGTIGANAAIYVAGRISDGTLSCVGTDCASETHWGIGGGAGVLTHLAGRAALDLGAQYYAFLPSDTDGGHPPHFLFFRAGISVGL
jgi:hypothetical protein